MDKTTILARLRLTIDFDRAGQRWLQQHPDAWFARDEGASFLSEFGHTWEALFIESAQAEIRSYFSSLGIPDDNLPFVKAGERYQGSWILEAAVVLCGTVGTAYTIMKGVSELPDMAEGLTKLKKQIVRRFQPQLNSAVRERLIQSTNPESVNKLELKPSPPPPPNPVTIDLVIDARPLLSLTPALMKAHRVHLSIAISRDSFSLENLGEEPMRNVQVGLFRSKTGRHEWRFQDAYASEVLVLSPKQTVAKRLDEFRDPRGDVFDMSDGEAAHVDCWVQDFHGIYLFQFFLEQE
ncbi:MAG: hypothetical protein HZA51_18325 [Planctomycetes bacterium]|nr:hypothetical protein [Planctomycetota bacterium]